MYQIFILIKSAFFLKQIQQSGLIINQTDEVNIVF